MKYARTKGTVGQGFPRNVDDYNYLASVVSALSMIPKNGKWLVFLREIISQSIVYAWKLSRNMKFGQIITATTKASLTTPLPILWAKFKFRLFTKFQRDIWSLTFDTSNPVARRREKAVKSFFGGNGESIQNLWRRCGIFPWIGYFLSCRVNKFVYLSLDLWWRCHG